MNANDSDYEDLADELDDYDEHGQSGKRAQPGGYLLTNVLKLPRATTYSTQALYDQVHAGDIDLEPEYQRDVVWPESKQIGLIDSILRNFYVPPIIFVAHQHDDGSETKTCIDGKQRLTSIHRFMDGLIPHRDPLTGTKYFYKTVAGQRGLLLPDRYRRLFANKQIVCIEYQDLPDSDEREIFQRVQLGMALTPAEKLQVINTPMSTFVRKLQAQYFHLGSALDSESLDWDRSRGGDFRCITQALYIISKYPSSIAIGAIPQLEKWLHHPTSKPNGSKKKAKTVDTTPDLSSDDTFLARAHATFGTFSQLVADTSLHPFFLKPEWRVSPIEFVMICLLISVNKDVLSVTALAGRIGEMRSRVRAEHVDVRMNARVAKTMFDFITETSGTAGSAEIAKLGVKRKREDAEDLETGGDKVEVAVKSEPKERREDELETRSPSSVIPPPRPDRLMALREAKKVIAPPRVASPKPLLTPTLR